MAKCIIQYYFFKQMQYVLFLFLFLAFTDLCTGQVDAKSAFSKLKKYTGTWQTEGEGEKVFETWTIDKKNKNAIALKRYTINNQNTVQMMEATIDYSKFVRFVHTNSLHYNIKAIEENAIYPFRLEYMEGNTFEFSNFNNPYPNKIIYHFLDKNTLTVSIILKDKQKEEILNYKRNP